jgi:uncharacterized membrane protein YhaH (DUF805 family)
MEEWYFAKDGEQDGPVTTQQIQALVSAGHLDPANAHVWREGMEDWITLEESGLLAEPTSSAGALPVPSIPTAATKISHPVSERTYQEPVRQDFEVEAQYPGYGRLRYFLTNLVVTAVFYAGIFAVALMLFNSAGGSEDAGAAGGIGMLLLMLIMMVATFYIAYKRVINLGMSGVAVLWTLVPFVNLWIGWRMVACPPGYEHHRTLDAPAKIITGIFLGMIALVVVGNILAVFLQN